MRSHLDALQAMQPVNTRRGPREFHSVAKQASFYIAFGAHFQGFWKAKWLPKFDFRGFFFRCYFSLRLIEHPILVDFSRFRTRKIVIFPRENNDFCKIRFQRPKRRKSVQISNPKTCCFEPSNLKGFFRCILESKNHQQIANIRKKMTFEGVLCSTIALELLFGWSFSPSELDFE